MRFFAKSQGSNITLIKFKPLAENFHVSLCDFFSANVRTLSFSFGLAKEHRSSIRKNVRTLRTGIKQFYWNSLSRISKKDCPSSPFAGFLTNSFFCNISMKFLPTVVILISIDSIFYSLIFPNYMLSENVCPTFMIP